MTTLDIQSVSNWLEESECIPKNKRDKRDILAALKSILEPTGGHHCPKRLNGRVEPLIKLIHDLKSDVEQVNFVKEKISKKIEFILSIHIQSWFSPYHQALESYDWLKKELESINCIIEDLTAHQAEVLAVSEVQDLIRQKKITVKDFLTFSDTLAYTLRREGVPNLILNDKLSLDQLRQLSDQQLEALWSKHVIDQIESGSNLFGFDLYRS